VVRHRRVDNTWPVAALQHAVEPDIESELRFLPTPPAFDAPVWGPCPTLEYCHAVWYGKSRVIWLPDSKKKGEKIEIITRLEENTNVTDGRTEGTDTA